MVRTLLKSPLDGRQHTKRELQENIQLKPYLLSRNTSFTIPRDMRPSVSFTGIGGGIAEDLTIVR
jgi:hypothetical protein